jgi:hypothetical protein
MMKGRLVVAKIFIKERLNIKIQILFQIQILIQILAVMMIGTIIKLKKLSINITMMLKAADQILIKKINTASLENFVTKERAVVKELVIGKNVTHVKEAGAIEIVAVKENIVVIKTLTKILKSQIIMTLKQEKIHMIDGTRQIMMKKKKKTKNLKEMKRLLSAKSKILFSNRTKILTSLKNLTIKLLKRI